MAASIIEKILVDLIREDQQIVRDGDLRDDFQFVSRQHLAGRIAGGIDNDGLRPRTERALNNVRHQRPVRCRQFCDHGDRLDGPQCAHMILIIGFEQNHFVAGAEQGQTGGVKCSCGAGAHRNLRLGVCANVIVPRELARQCRPELE